MRTFEITAHVEPREDAPNGINIYTYADLTEIPFKIQELMLTEGATSFTIKLIGEK